MGLHAGLALYFRSLYTKKKKRQEIARACKDCVRMLERVVRE